MNVPTGRRPVRRLALTLTLPAYLALAGCGGGTGDHASASTPAAGSATGSAAGSTASAPGRTGQSPAPPALPPTTYTASGGFDGRSITVTFQAGGRWSRTDTRAGNTAGQLSPEQITTLDAALESPALASEARDGSPAAPPHCADYITQILRTRALLVGDWCGGNPRPALNRVAALVRRYTGS